MITFSSAGWVSLPKGGREKMVMEPNKPTTTTTISGESPLGAHWRVNYVYCCSRGIRDPRRHTLKQKKGGRTPGLELQWQFLDPHGEKEEIQMLWLVPNGGSR